MITVVMVTSSYPRYDADNASTFLLHLTTHLQQRGIDVHVIAPDSDINTQYNNERIHRFSYFIKRWQKLAYGSGIPPNLKRNPLLWLLVPFFLFSMFFKLVTIVKKHHPDIIHAHWILPQGLIAVVSKLFLKKPVVVTAHGTDAYAYSSAPFSWLKQFTLNNCSAWTANTVATAKAAWPSTNDHRANIIPMGVDVNHFSSGIRQKYRKNNGSTKIILFVGRLVEKKGVQDLLRAIAMLPPSLRSTVRLWVIGDGNEQPKLESLVKQLEISPLVKFWGQVANAELPHYYAAADLFVGPTITEGQGVVFIEAFASRVSVIATRVGGLPEVVENGVTGLLVEPKSPEQLSKAIEELLSNNRKRSEFANNAYAVAKNNYDWNRVSATFSRLYQDVLLQAHHHPNAANK